jgi:hypothetical protein
MTAHDELIAVERAAILRHARVTQIKRTALGLAPRVHRKLPLPKKARRVLFIFPSKYAKLMRCEFNGLLPGHSASPQGQTIVARLADGAPSRAFSKPFASAT